MKYSTQELMDIAIGIEENGYYFYTRCREKFSDESYKQLLGFLAEEELRHKDLFEKLLSEIGDIKGIFTDEYFQYVRAIGDERIFKDHRDVDRVVTTVTTMEDIFKIALTAEKDSILFYTELLAMYEKNREAKTVLNKLINEERRHIVTILEYMEKVRLARD